MAKKQDTPALGAEFGGGFYAGDITIDAVRYALVVAPKSAAEKMEVQYKVKDRTVFDGTTNDNDGFDNSETINDDNHSAAHFCRSLRIAGHDDWYLPSRDELTYIWMNLGPNRAKTLEPFKAGSAEAFEDRWYWSSTEHAQGPDYAWIVDFSDGYQGYNCKDYGSGVRAVRRLII